MYVVPAPRVMRPAYGAGTAVAQSDEARVHSERGQVVASAFEKSELAVVTLVAVKAVL